MVMYKIDRRGLGEGGQKSLTRTDPEKENNLNLSTQNITLLEVLVIS